MVILSFWAIKLYYLRNYHFVAVNYFGIIYNIAPHQTIPSAVVIYHHILTKEIRYGRKLQRYFKTLAPIYKLWLISQKCTLHKIKFYDTEPKKCLQSGKAKYNKPPSTDQLQLSSASLFHNTFFTVCHRNKVPYIGG